MTTNRSAKFENLIGSFEYITTSNTYYPKYTFLIATPEKALCDMITTTPQLRIQSEKALLVYLEEDLRFDMSALDDMDTDIIKGCVKAGKKKTMLKLLLNLLQR